jgi:hypothetical protein
MNSGPLDREIIASYLNRCLQADPEMMAGLMTKTVVNNPSTDNPVVCSSNPTNGVFETSALGLLNGALAAIGMKPVYAAYNKDDPAKLERFEA